jgi:hypothetical protein
MTILRCRRHPERPRDLIAPAKGVSVVELPLERIADIIFDLTADETVSKIDSFLISGPAFRSKSPT